MLGIWHGGEWLKRYLAQPFYGWVECSSPISSLDFTSLMEGHFSCYFYEYYDGLYVVYIVVVSWIISSLLCFGKNTERGGELVFKLS